jgi:peptidoglycan/LPS O-acetylase OafA/YrhL
MDIVMPAWKRASEKRKRIASYVIDAVLIVSGLVLFWCLQPIDDLIGTNLFNASHTEFFSPLTTFTVLILSLNTGFVARMLSTKPFQIIGSMSYEIYLLHGPVSYTLRNIYYDHNYRFVYTMPFVLIVCHLCLKHFSTPSYEYVLALIEKPAPHMKCMCNTNHMVNLEDKNTDEV